MQAVTTVGLDIAKTVFQVRGIGTSGNVVIRRQLKRGHAARLFTQSLAARRSRNLGLIAPSDGPPNLIQWLRELETGQRLFQPCFGAIVCFS